MKSLPIVLVLVLAAAAPARAAWQHWDPQPGTPYTNTMALDYYDGLRERADAAVGTNAFSITQSYTAFAGWTNRQDGAAVPHYVSVTRTNRDCFLPWTADGRTHVPHLTRELLGQMDAILENLCPYYAQYWLASNGTFEAYFTRPSASTNYAIAAPMCSLSAVLQHVGKGYVPDAHTNDWGAIDEGTGYFSYCSRTPQAWPVSEIWWDGEWHVRGLAKMAQQGGGNYPLLFSTNDLPVLRYYPAGTNRTALTLQLTGHNLYAWDYAVTETVHVGSAGDLPLTNQYSRMDSCTGGAAANTGDTWAVIYTNVMVAGAAHSSPNLFAAAFDERYRVIDALRWTVLDVTFTNGVAGRGEGRAETTSPPWPDNHAELWAEATGKAQSDWNLTNSAAVPGARTEGWISYGGTYALAVASKATPVAAAPAVGISRSADFYLSVLAVGTNWHAYGSGLDGRQDGKLFLFGTAPAGTNALLCATELGSTEFPQPWCDEPGWDSWPYTATSMGWSLRAFRVCVVKWAFGKSTN